MTYTLTRRGQVNDPRVVLVNSWAPEGSRYSRDDYLPGTKKGKTGKDITGREFVRLRLLKPGEEPELSCDEPDKLTAWAWEYLTHGMPQEWVKLAELYYELTSAGHKLPPVELGPSLRNRPFARVA